MEARRLQREIDEARKAFEAAAGGRTRDEIREDARQLIAEIDRLREGAAPDGGLEIREPGGTDYKPKLKEAIDAANRADEALRRPDAAPDLVVDLQAATRSLSEAVGLLDLAKKRVPELAAEELAARKTQMAAAEKQASEGKKRQAFEGFQKLLKLAELPSNDRADTGGLGKVGTGNPSQVELGSFAVADLIDLGFSLAVPKETIDGAEFKPEIAAVGEDRWEIGYVPKQTLGLDGGVKPETVATLKSRDGTLVLEVGRLELSRPALAVLRRCVILAEAKNPATKELERRQIRLVKPTKVGRLKLEPTAGRQAIQIRPPPGITRRDAPPGGSQTNLAFPVSGLEVKGRFGGQEKTIRFPEDAKSPGIWSEIIEVKPLSNGMTLTMKVELSLPDATLACTPGLANPAGGGNQDLAGLAGFGQKQGKSLADIKKTFEKRVKKCPGRKYETAHGTPGQVEQVLGWFQPTNKVPNLACYPLMGLELPGHLTIRQSIDLFLRERYKAEDNRLQQDYDRKVAAAKDDEAKNKIERAYPKSLPFFNGFEGWTNACVTADQAKWPEYFDAPLDAWAAWFWKEFEAEWKRREVLAESVRGQGMDAEILEITSVARGADDTEHRVTLVEFDPDAPVERVGPPGGRPPGPAAPDAMPAADNSVIGLD
jgi:hypothetical protein